MLREWVNARVTSKQKLFPELNQIKTSFASIQSRHISN